MFKDVDNSTLLSIYKDAKQNLPLIINEIVNGLIDIHKLKGKKIFLKPNLTFKTPKDGVTTNINLVENIVSSFLSHGCDVIIGEGDAAAYAWTTRDSFEKHGLIRIADKYNVKLISLSELEWAFETVMIDGKEYQFEVVKNFSQIADYTISLPVIKTHAMTNISLGLKNLWGCIPNPMRLLHHDKLHYIIPKIADYYNLIGTIFDGIISLTGNGPMYGTPIYSNIIAWTSNPIKADILLAHLMNVDPTQVKHLIGSAKYYNIDIPEIINNHKNDRLLVEYSSSKTRLNKIEGLTFKSRMLSSIVFTSSLSPIIYWLFNLLKPKGERNSSPWINYRNDKRKI